jgi:hypothetical protein
MPEKPLHAQPDRLRDVVERLLSIFLSDPLAQPLDSDEPVPLLSTPGSKQKVLTPALTRGQKSPFDLPSSAARPALSRSIPSGQVHTGSPLRKRKDDAD